MEYLVVFVFILILVIFIQSKKIEKLNAKIFQLKKELENLKSNKDNDNLEQFLNNGIENSKIDLLEKIGEVKEIKNEEVFEKSKVIENDEIEEKIFDSYASKNLSILITGSILIVLAAIVFLTTAWQSIPDLLKTVVLFLVAFVFLGASKISKDKYHLEKASKTFFYIGMAYLPICLLSISIFGLFGTYLSVNGEGRYIYLGLSTLIISFVYHIISKKSNDRYLFYGSMLSQILSVILFTLMFEERLFLVFINLLLYNLLLIIVVKDDVLKVATNIIPGTIAGGSVTEIGQGTWYFVFTCLLLSINFLCLEIKNRNILKAYLFNIFLFIFGFNLICKDSLNFSDGTCQVLLTIFTFLVVIIENFIFSNVKENKNILSSCRIISLIAIGYIYIASLFDSDLTVSSYLIGILAEMLLLYNYKSSKNFIYKYLGYAFSNILFVDIINNFFKDFEIINYVPMFTTMVIILYEIYVKKDRDVFLPIYILGFEALSIIFATIENTEVGVILVIVFTSSSLYFNKKIEISENFNAIPLLCALFCIIQYDLNEQLEIGIMILATIGLTYFSVKTEEINVYTIISGIYLFVLGDEIIDNEYLMEILYIVWSIMHIYFYKNDKSKDAFKVLLSIFVSMLYYSIIEDMELLDITLFQLLGVVVSGIYILRNIVTKYYKDIDIIEYIFWGSVYLYALSNYTDSRDGILFSILIVSIIFFSYYKKYGVTFLASIIAILVNGFALTRQFWFSIPWWIYLLIVGGSLVGFAIKNEANENKQKITVGSVLKKIKDTAEK